MNIPTSDVPVSPDYIPYPIRSQINQIDPRLDVFWQDYLLGILKDLSEHDRRNVAGQLLVPKKIFWDNHSKTFEYAPDGSEDSLVQLLSDIPPHAHHFKAFAQGSTHYLKHLKSYEHVEQIADFLENILDKIQELPTDEDTALQNLKQRLYTEFIYACGEIIRNKPELTLPDNYRGLNSNILKTFINEVYLKHKLLGYWFKTLSHRELADLPSELLNDFLHKQQKIRQLEIIRTSKYIFALAPTVESDKDPFAIRRFLQEETLFSQNQIIFNGVALNPTLLTPNSGSYQDTFKQQIGCIITLQSDVRIEIFDFLEEVEYFHGTVLLPLLFSPWPTDMPLNKAVGERLLQYEKLLVQNILYPLREVLLNTVGNNNEHDVLYIGMRRLFGNILSTFKEFLSLPALLLNEQADLLFGRLVGYTLFLEKRRKCVFVMQSREVWRQQSALMHEPVKQLSAILSRSIEQHRELNKEILSRQAAVEAHNSLMDILLKRKQREQEALNRLKRRSGQAQLEAYQQMLSLPRSYPEQVVHLEFDSLLMSSENKRHYAFPAGDNGITRLPVVMPLPTNGLNFNLTTFAYELNRNVEQTEAGPDAPEL